jgi:hypothetical protein
MEKNKMNNVKFHQDQEKTYQIIYIIYINPIRFKNVRYICFSLWKKQLIIIFFFWLFFINLHETNYN